MRSGAGGGGPSRRTTRRCSCSPITRTEPDRDGGAGRPSTSSPTASTPPTRRRARPPATTASTIAGGASTVRQALIAGVVDELTLDIAPVAARIRRADLRRRRVVRDGAGGGAALTAGHPHPLPPGGPRSALGGPFPARASPPATSATSAVEDRGRGAGRARAAVRRGSRARSPRRCRRGKNAVAAAVHDQRRERDLGQALAPARLAVELGEHRCPAGWPSAPRVRCRACGPRRARRAARGDGVVAEDLRAAGGDTPPPAARSVQSGIGRENSRPHRRLVVVGQVVVDAGRGDAPGADQGERRERAPGGRARRPGRPSRRRRSRRGAPAARRARRRAPRRRRRGRAGCTPGASGSTVVDSPAVAQVVAHDAAPAARRGASQSASGHESIVVPPASRTSGAAASPNRSTPMRDSVRLDRLHRRSSVRSVSGA